MLRALLDVRQRVPAEHVAKRSLQGTFTDAGLCRTNLTGSCRHIVPTTSDHFVQVVVRQVYEAAQRSAEGLMSPESILRRGSV
jgi:hypothetical protein